MITFAKNQQDVKKLNRSLILRLICTEQVISRIDLSRITGLSKMTVTNLVSGLIEEGLVKEGSASGKQEGAGRKPIVLLPCEDSVFAAGIYISRDFVKFSLLTLHASVVQTNCVLLSSGEDSQSLLKKILKGIQEIIKLVPTGKIAGIGVACIGPIDVNKGIILSPPDFYGISNVKIKEYLEENTGLPAIINTDTKASAIAEKLFGIGRDLHNFIYVGITHGIGSGIIVDDKLYMGEMGFAGEIGHTAINFNGPVCSCGRKGCLETYASVTSIIKSAHQQIESGKPTILTGIKDFTFKDITENIKTDELCKKLIHELAFYLGCALVNTINTLDLSTVIIGHEGAYGGEFFAKLIEKEINDHILFRNTKCVKVEISKFKDECPVIGSGALVLERIFN